MRVTLPALGSINLLFGDQGWSAINGLARGFGPSGGANIDRIAGGKGLLARMLQRQMTLTIPTDDDTGMVFVEKRSELHSAAGLQWPQRGR